MIGFAGQWSLPVAGGLALAGAVVGWLARLVVTRRRESDAAIVAASRVKPSVVESGFLRNEVMRLRAVEASLQERIDAYQANEVELEVLRQRLADVEPATTAAIEERNRLQNRVAELIRAVGQAEAERLRLASRVDRVEEEARNAAVALIGEREHSAARITEVETAKALMTTELLDLKRRVASLTGSEELVRAERDAARVDRDRLASELTAREAEYRREQLVNQAAQSEAAAQIGALEAQIGRIDALKARLDDRETILRALASERDQAIGHALERHQEVADLGDQLRREVALRATQGATLADATNRIAFLEAEVARLTKEREDRTGLAIRTAGEIETLKSEIKDRDTRFRTLLEDRRRIVEEHLAEIGRLRARLGAATMRKNGASALAADQLQQIVGIGPSIERLLREQGVMGFRQIAEWTELDIERIGALLGSFRDRIRRDDWVGQARRLLEDTSTTIG